MRANGFTDSDAILAVATEERGFSFRVPGAAINGTAIDVEAIRRDRIEPAVARIDPRRGGRGQRTQRTAGLGGQRSGASSTSASKQL